MSRAVTPRHTGGSRPYARIFLDAGVVIEGVYSRWGAAKGVLILVAVGTNFRAAIAEPVTVEIDRNMRRRTSALPTQEAERILAGLTGWFRIARPERLPWPTDDQMEAHAGLLSAVRHDNDIPAVVAAVLAQPEWVLSTNTEHWNQDVAQRTGLRIAHPVTFLERLHAE